MKSNLLYIDDDRDDHELFQAALATLSYDIKCSFINNATDALAMIENKSISPDLIFLDLNMPFVTGIDFLLEFRKLPQSKIFPIIIYSTTANPVMIKTAKELGARDYIVKPPSFDELVEVLGNYIMK